MATLKGKNCSHWQLFSFNGSPKFEKFQSWETTSCLQMVSPFQTEGSIFQVYPVTLSGNIMTFVIEENDAANSFQHMEPVRSII